MGINGLPHGLKYDIYHSNLKAIHQLKKVSEMSPIHMIFYDLALERLHQL